MKYGRLILSIEKDSKINVIEKIKQNESLQDNYLLIIKNIEVKVLPLQKEYYVDYSSKIELIIDNTNTDLTTRFEIDYQTPLKCRDCFLKEIEIETNEAKILIDYAF